MEVEYKSPLKNKGTLRKLIDYYFKSKDINQFSKKVQNNASFRNFSIQNSEKYAITQFRKILLEHWRYEIENTNANTFPYKKYGLTEEELYFLKSFFASVNNSISLEKNISNSEYRERINELFKKFKYLKKVGEEVEVSSYMLNINQEYEVDCEYILSINIKSTATIYKIIKKYIEMCFSNNIPFKFNYMDSLNSDCTITIYCSSKNLKQNINMLESIRFNDPELDSEIMDVLKDTPILFGTVNDWIGIRKIEDNFYEKRIECLHKSIDELISKWYDIDFREKKSEIGDSTYNELLIDSLIDLLYSKYYRQFNYKIPDFILKRKIETFVNQINDTRWNDIDTFSLTILFNKRIIITKEDIKNIIYGFMPSIYRKYSYFNDELINIINKICLEYDIDPKYFSIDEINFGQKEIDNNKLLLGLCYMDYDGIIWRDYETYLMEKGKTKRIK